MAAREEQSDGPGPATRERDAAIPNAGSPGAPAPGADRYADRNHTIDADEDDWAWRAKIRANPTTRMVYRVLIAVLGLAVIALGVVLLPAPGPGWLIIFAGLGLWASEFEWAHRVLEFAKRHVRSWTTWLGQQSIWVKGLVGIGCLVLILAVFYVLFLVTGVPTWIWDFAQDILRGLPGLS